jgi:hypothetical protein
MSWAAMLLSALSHHGEADPTLLEWIKGVLDHLIGLGPWTVVILLGLLVLAIPAGVIVFYLAQQRQALTPGPSPSDEGRKTEDEPFVLRLSSFVTRLSSLAKAKSE